MAEKGRDRWAAWLLERRHGGDPEDLKATMDFLTPVRDRVLGNASLTGGESSMRKLQMTRSERENRRGSFDGQST